ADRIVDGQPGSRSDGEMRGVDGIAHQDDMVHAIEVMPAPAANALEIDPGRTPLVARVAHQPMAVQMGREESFAEGDRLLLAGRGPAKGTPGRFRAFDDEGTGRLVEAMDMRLEPAVPGLLEDEVEGVEELVRAQPDEAVR